MKKHLCVLFALALLVGFVLSDSALAQFGNKVADTPHNLRKATVSGMTLTDYGEICVYCHTPHNNNLEIEAPLWNRETPAASYTMYDSPTLDMDIANSPQGVSLACLSCHDATIALDQVINIPPSAFGATSSGVTIENCATASCHTGDSPADGLHFAGTFIDTDLGNDHPISVTYDDSKDPNFHAASGGKVGNLPLYGPNKDRVECASCHNPHDNSYRPFLRATNENSALCLTCHDI